MKPEPTHCVNYKDCAAQFSCKLAVFSKAKLGGAVGQTNKGMDCKNYKYKSIPRGR